MIDRYNDVNDLNSYIDNQSATEEDVLSLPKLIEHFNNPSKAIYKYDCLTNLDYSSLDNLEGMNKYYSLNRNTMTHVARHLDIQTDSEFIQKYKHFSGLYGLLIGDALGQPMEFKRKPYLDSFEEYQMIDYYRNNPTIAAFKSGYFTDDGSLALCNLLVLRTYFKRNPQLIESWIKQDYEKQYFQCQFDENRHIKTVLKDIFDIMLMSLNTMSFWYSDNPHNFLSTTKNNEDCGRTIRRALTTFRSIIMQHIRQEKVDGVFKTPLEKAQESKTAIINNLVKDNQLDQVTLDNLEELLLDDYNFQYLYHFITHSLSETSISNSGNGTLMKQSPISIEVYHQFLQNQEIQSLVQKYKDMIQQIIVDIKNQTKNENNQNMVDHFVAQKNVIYQILDHDLIQKLFKYSNQLSIIINRVTHQSVLCDYLCVFLNMFIISNLLFNEIGYLNKETKYDSKFKTNYLNDVFGYIKQYISNDMSSHHINFFDNYIDSETRDVLQDFFSTIKVEDILPQHEKISFLVKIKDLLGFNNFQYAQPEYNQHNPEFLLLDYKNLPNNGYSLDSLKSAYWCFAKSNSFEDSIVKAANLYGDADSIAAICGQLSGSYYGFEDIMNRKDWIEGLAMKEVINYLIVT